MEDSDAPGKIGQRLPEIRKSSGGTPTERVLAQLCESTFLSLWSYPNVYTPEGRVGGTGQGKELCDVLVVFGEHAIVFSDKDVAYSENPDRLVSWQRWKRRAIDKSKRQLWGAEKWLQEHGLIYLDSLCQTQFPLPIERTKSLKVHLVAVTNNSYRHAESHFGSGSSGSNMLFPEESDDFIESNPFTLNHDPRKKFIHVFDEETLQIVLGELDTVYDLLGYLSAKEDAFKERVFKVVSGEEDLLAHYILSGGLASHKFPAVPEGYEGCAVEEGIWRSFSTSQKRIDFKNFNKEGLFWDVLIESFAQHILAGTAPAHNAPDTATHEQALRWLAREGRVARRILSLSFIDKLASTLPDRRSSRLCQSPTFPDTLFILVLFPINEDEDYEQYRQDRIAIMHLYALVAKRKFPRFKKFAIIASEPLGSRFGSSQDVLAAEIDGLDPEMERFALEVENKEKILNDIAPMKLSGNPTSPMKFVGTRQGRNEKCRCGSGIKYKRCCGS